MRTKDILDLMPYTKPFLFVDKLLRVDDSGAEGIFTFDAGLDFFKGHFKGNPITPGVLLTECCAQIGLVCLGIHLLKDQQETTGVKIGMSSSQMDFLKPVLPNEKVRVVSKKIYFRFQKLKCEVRMYNSKEELVCKGTLAGMLKSDSNE
ncbi:3-hydroxyacyl-ACP dehydratase FabZ family protein [Maribacter chungangensis]|uniref:3-hydroxyacyl-ACP dehydratase FabZ family protein n=1 Tax=Maribacter chungangensis TaxID=1069117 RepID=A0ABW3B301_9FLAO